MERETTVAPRTPSRRRWGQRARAAAALVTVAALAAVAVSALVLVGEFRPDLLVDVPSGSLVAVVDPGFRYAPQPWVRIHELGLDVAVTAAFVWAALTAALVRTGSRGRTVAVMVGAVVAVLAATVAGLSWGLVRWDQLALWEVMAAPVGLSRGLWAPAFDGRVRFLLVGGAEVGQGTYRRALLVHLGAPVVAIVAIATSAWMSRRPRPSERDITDRTNLHEGE